MQCMIAPGKKTNLFGSLVAPFATLTKHEPPRHLVRIKKTPTSLTAVVAFVPP